MTHENLSNRDYLLLRAYQSGLRDMRELAAFMGQMDVESGGFASMHENLNYSGARLVEVFPGRNGVRTLTAANAVAAGGPEAVANSIYGGEWGRRNLGNTELGDGWRFHGRGYVQLTGRDNYSRVVRETGLDVVADPELASGREIAASIAIHYWQNRVVQRGHQHDVREATHDINGGYNHLPERRSAVSRWEQALTPHVMERLSRGEVVLPTRKGDERRLAVRALQNDLNTLGFGDDAGERLVVDGNSGLKTSQAIANFQRRYGLPSSGAADPLTLAAIEIGVREVKLLKAAKNFGLDFLPPSYMADRLEIGANGMPEYLLSPSNIQSAVAAESVNSRNATTTAKADSYPTTNLAPDVVRILQAQLNALRITDSRSHPLAPDGDYGHRTREAVTKFQEQQGLEPTGIADDSTRAAINAHAIVAELQQRKAERELLAEPPSIFELDPYYAPNRVPTPDAVGMRPNIEPAPRRAVDVPDYTSPGQIGFNSAAWPSSTVANPLEAQLAQLHREMSALQEQMQQGVLPRREASAQIELGQPPPPAVGDTAPSMPLPNDRRHPDFPLFDAIRRQLPPGTSDEMAAHVTLQAKIGGVDSIDEFRHVTLRNGHAFVIGRTPGDDAKVDLSMTPPPLQETLQQSSAFDRQQSLHLAQIMEQQRQINERGGPGLSL